MVTREELDKLEKETKLRWLGILMLAVRTRRALADRGNGSTASGKIRDILRTREAGRSGAATASPARESRPTRASSRQRTEEPTAADTPAEEKTPEEKPETNPAVVMVLNNHQEAESLAEAMRADGTSAGTVASPQEAYAMSADENVKVFVVDEDYIKSTTDTWRFRKNRVMPVAVIGNSPEREGWDRVVQLDADAYLSKSTDQSEQVARIKALVRRA